MSIFDDLRNIGLLVMILMLALALATIMLAGNNVAATLTAFIPLGLAAVIGFAIRR